MRTVALLATVSCLTMSCSHIEGPQPIIRSTGVVRTQNATGLVSRFYVAATEAAHQDEKAGKSEMSTKDLASYDKAQRRMLDAGFTLIYSKCSDFFYSSGKDQTRVMTFKDAVATLGTLAVGAIALIDFNSDSTRNDVLTVVGLGTSATMAGIDIYTQRFLFGADNVDAVRELTLRAINDQQREVRRVSSFSYDDVVKNILDVQATCTPRRIALLAGNAIKQGQVTASQLVSTAAASTPLPADVVDDALLSRLSSILQVDRPLTTDEQTALYWITNATPLQTEAANIRNLLKSVPGAEGAFEENGDVSDNWANAQSVSVLFDNLSSEKRMALAKEVQNKRLGAALTVKNESNIDLPPMAVTPVDSLPQAPSTAGTRPTTPSLTNNAPTTEPNYSGRVTIDVVPNPPS